MARSTSTERAFSSLASNTTAAELWTVELSYLGMRFTNNTGQTLASFTLTYDGEQWRDGGAATPVAQSLLFSYKTTNGACRTSGYGFYRGAAPQFH